MYCFPFCLLNSSGSRASSHRLAAMEEAVERVRNFIAKAQTRAGDIDQEISALEATLAVRGSLPPDVALRKELVIINDERSSHRLIYREAF